MKNGLFLLLLLISFAGFAQDKYSPEVKKGTRMEYIVYSNGQELPLKITVDSLAPEFIRLNWDITDYGNGSWSMKKNSLEKASKGWWGEPATGADMQLADDEAVLLISKNTWENLHKGQKGEIDNVLYSLKEPTDQQVLKLNGKVVNAILLESENQNSRIWVLNNAAFPAILKLEGNPMGIDLEVRKME